MTNDRDRVSKWLRFANLIGRGEVPQQRQTSAECTYKEDSRDHRSEISEKAAALKEYVDQ